MIYVLFLKRYDVHYLIRIKKYININDTQNVKDIYKKLETKLILINN